MTNLLKLYEAMRTKMGAKDAADIAAFIELNYKKIQENDIDRLASKIELNEIKLESKQDLSELKIELKQDISEVRIDLNKNIAETKTDVVRWIFVLFVTVALAFIGLYLKK